MHGPEGYLVADRRFFEPLSRRVQGPEYRAIVDALLPAGWRSEPGDVWLHAHPGGAGPPAAGFKIHLSTTPHAAGEALRRIVHVCVRHAAPFKLAADSFVLDVLNGKRCQRGSGGKFVTVYPDAARFVEVIEALHQATRGLEGPYILSDRRYRDSRVVFYRYGGFAPRYRLHPDGTRTPALEADDGTLLDDERTPYFHLPPGVEDPFPGGEPASDAPDGPLGGRFEVTEALAFSNAGGVYLALDRETDEVVVVKEARPLTHCWSDGAETLDAVAVLRREHEVLSRYAHLGVFPRPVALFQEWEHTFLAQERVRGEAFTTFRARDGVIVTNRMHEPERVAEFAATFRRVARALLDAVGRVHAAGAVVGDLSNHNVFVDPGTLGVRIIDVESVCAVGEEGAFARFAARWHTPGFRDRAGGPRAAGPTPADDHFALGMLLHGMLTPVQSFLELHPPARRRFLDRFTAAGMPPFVRDTVLALLEDRPGDARALLEEDDDDDR
jgi:hypothetical protein